MACMGVDVAGLLRDAAALPPLDLSPRIIATHAWDFRGLYRWIARS